MAVKQANSNYHTFTFNGVRAADYGIYVTDVNVFNSAARDVEYIQIPGRDGAFALDRGRFQNISVVYKCVMTQDTDEDFATAISEFRNAIASTKGYKRLEDDIHTDEYRMGVFSKGLEAPTLNTKTATFDVEFNCQPQRFLKSGETAVSVANGGTITNPTLFESHPLLMTKGYGNITIGTDVIDINNDPYGRLLLANAKATGEYIALDAGNMALMNTGDAITLSDGTTWRLVLTATAPPSIAGIASVTASVSGTLSGSVNAFAQGNTGYFDITLGDVGFVKGTTRSLTMTLEIGWTNNQGTTYSATVSYRCRFIASSNQIQFDKIVSGVTSPYQLAQLGNVFRVADVYGDSTKTPLDETVYIDTDIGEAYTEAGGVVSSANALVSLPAKLPVLKSGVNNITYDDTITRFDVVPRWWEV